MDDPLYICTIVKRTRVTNRTANTVVSSIDFCYTGASKVTRAKCGGGATYSGGEALLADVPGQIGRVAMF